MADGFAVDQAALAAAARGPDDLPASDLGRPDSELRGPAHDG